jgi:hypothetical protein
MMHIVYYSQKEQMISHLVEIKGDKKFISPSPAKADGLRTLLGNNSSQEVITIAKFTSNLINILWMDEKKPDVKRKSELLLIFGILKNKYFPALGYEQFNQAYNLFSDLRSFTLNVEALTSILDEQPQIIKEAIILFWKLLELTGYCDEHGAYQQITEKLRTYEINEELNQTYIFWGFQHLNGQQVDLLRALSMHHKVIIPFPISLKEKIKKSDWISWVKDNQTEETDLELKLNQPKATLVQTNSREISLHLKDLLQSGDQIVLGVSKLSPSHMDIIPSLEVSFKIPHHILNIELKEISDELKKFTGNHLDLSKICDDKMKTSRNLKHYKAWQLYSDSLTSILSLTDEIIIVDSFFLKVLAEVATLNQPRTSYFPVISSLMTIDLKDMSSLETIDRKRRIVFCIDERFEDIQGLGQNYTESIQKSLASIGPLKRNELEFYFKQCEFNDLFSHGEITVLMNESTLKHSIIWKRMFSDIKLDKREENISRKEKKLKDYLNEFDKSQFRSNFSASKYQDFIDCPRKFYFAHVDKIFPRIQLEKDFDSITSGTIIHEIIEKYFKQNLIDNQLHKLTRQVMNSYIKEKNLILSNEVFLQRELIFNHRSRNGIQFVKNLEEIVGEKVTWSVEWPFMFQNDYLIKGRVDCLGVSSQYLFLLDFKSTEYSASSFKEVVDLEAVQLWIYALASNQLLKEFKNKKIVMGYVILDDSSKSNLLSSDDEFIDKLKQSELSKCYKFKDDFLEMLHGAELKMNTLSATILSEENFPARPRKSSTCTYCELNKVCIKSEIINVPST